MHDLPIELLGAPVLRETASPDLLQNASLAASATPALWSGGAAPAATAERWRRGRDEGPQSEGDEVDPWA